MTQTRPLPAPGHGGVDFEMRVDFDRLRCYRLDRARKSLEASECGALLLFDFYNIRYTTQTWIGGALGDKMTRYALLTRDADPVLWDFGSAAKHHQLYSPWLRPEDCRAGMLRVARPAAPGRRHGPVGHPWLPCRLQREDPNIAKPAGGVVQLQPM